MHIQVHSMCASLLLFFIGNIVLHSQTPILRPISTIWFKWKNPISNRWNRSNGLAMSIWISTIQIDQMDTIFFHSTQTCHMTKWYHAVYNSRWSQSNGSNWSNGSNGLHFLPFEPHVSNGQMVSCCVSWYCVGPVEWIKLIKRIKWTPFFCIRTWHVEWSMVSRCACA